MSYDDFIGEVQHRIESGTPAEAVRTTRAVLETLGERLTEGEATDLASPLPIEIDRYLLQAEHGQKYGYDEFVDRVMEKLNYEDLDLQASYALPAGKDRSEAVYRTKAVFALLAEEVPEGEMEDIEQQLTEDFEELFEFIEMEDLPWSQEG